MAKQRKARLQGLFTGVDRYVSPDVQELRYAEQGAIALHTLFADNLGDGGDLLIGADAARAEIERRFEQLSKVSSHDVVLVSFRGKAARSSSSTCWGERRWASRNCTVAVVRAWLGPPFA